MKTWLYIVLALIAFAGNSVLGRMALAGDTIDPASFTAVRLFAGALVLVGIVSWKHRATRVKSAGSWKASLYLFVYAVAFSFAYLILEAGTGALVLFGAVQLTVIGYSFFSGQKLRGMEWVGYLIALGGFLYLVLPSVSTPSLLGFVLMSLSGVAWGLYTLSGHNSQSPLTDTAGNFLRTLPLLPLMIVCNFGNYDLTLSGLMLAILSGAVSSGLGYTVWYMALRRISSVQAAVLQLLVPVLAALGGVMFLNESISVHLAIASLVIFGGVIVVLKGRK